VLQRPKICWAYDVIGGNKKPVQNFDGEALGNRPSGIPRKRGRSVDCGLDSGYSGPVK
jgi:hypothetical protein